jgi:hypothetical protein
MFSLLKVLPVVLAVALAGIFYHTWTLRGFENRQVELQMQIDALAQTNAVLQAASEINQRTINQMEANTRQQLSQIGDLTLQVTQVQRERDEYLGIFRRHDLTNLARARPGLIEPRINNGTADVFRQLQEDTQP